MTLSPARQFLGRCLLTILITSWVSPALFSSAHAASADINLTQSNGETLSLTKPARRIITLAPNLAELVFAAGAGQYLQAVVEYSNFPSEVARLPRVGDAFRVDLERILELEPDLVIAWTSGNPQTALHKLEQLGINVWQIEIGRPEEIADSIEAISRATGTEATGQAVALQLRAKLERLKAQNQARPPLTFFYQIAARPLYTINGEHIISRSLEVCAVRNVFSDLPALAPQVSPESLLVANPQVMIAPAIAGDPPALDTWKNWPHLQAIENNALVYLPADEISQATPRLLDSIELACKLLDQVRTTTLELEE